MKPKQVSANNKYFVIVSLIVFCTAWTCHVLYSSAKINLFNESFLSVGILILLSLSAFCLNIVEFE